MKKLIFSFLAVIALTFSVAAQRTATTATESEFKEMAEEFTYVFTMPGNVSYDIAMFQADALTDYMEVEFNEDSQRMKIILLTGHMDEKTQVKRMLYGLGMEKVQMDNVEYDIMDFVQDFVEVH